MNTRLERGRGVYLFEITGATARNRTADILITSEVLCRLSYGGSGESNGG